MPWRLTYKIRRQQARIQLTPGDHELGSGESVSVRLMHPTVSRRHARLSVGANTVALQDLGSRNGTWIAGKRIEETVSIIPGARICFGAVESKLELVKSQDLEAAFRVAPQPDSFPGQPIQSTGGHRTLPSRAIQQFTFEALPRILGFLRNSDVEAIAHAVGGAIFREFPCTHVEITGGAPGKHRLLFMARAENHPALAEEETVEGGDQFLKIRMAFYPAAFAQTYGPLVDLAYQLVSLVAQETEQPIAKPGTFDPPPLPRPPTLVPFVQQVYARAARIARGGVNILIQGESGTGKEVLARYVHSASACPPDRFVVLNCAALPRDLLEMELFGIEERVATGVDARPGKFELAHGGLLFLDEIGDMALETQAKILRVLQEGEVLRIGAKAPLPARVQVVAATNKDLDALLDNGAFRRDLYHRLAGWVVKLPPLRERVPDIPNLAAYFVAEQAQALGLSGVGLSRSAVSDLMHYSWPGNIRELQATINRTLLFLEAGELIESPHLQLSQETPIPVTGKGTLKQSVELFERRLIQETLAESPTIREAAKRLGIARSTLYRRMKDLQIDEFSAEPSAE